MELPRHSDFLHNNWVKCCKTTVDFDHLYNYKHLHKTVITFPCMHFFFFLQIFFSLHHSPRYESMSLFGLLAISIGVFCFLPHAVLSTCQRSTIICEACDSHHFSLILFRESETEDCLCHSGCLIPSV